MRQAKHSYILAISCGFAALAGLTLPPPAHAQLKPAGTFLQPSRRGVQIINIETGRLRYLGSWYHWAISPNGQHVAGGAVEGKNDAIYSVYTAPLTLTAPPKKLAQLPFGGGVYHQNITWQADSKRLKVEGENFKTGKEEAFIASLDRPGALTRTSPTPDSVWEQDNSTRSPNRRYRCAFISKDRILVVKDTRTGKEIRRVDTRRGGRLASSSHGPGPWSADSGNLLFVISGEADGYPKQNDRLCALDIRSGQVRTLSASLKSITEALYSPNGQWIALTGGNGRYTDARYSGGIYLVRSNGTQWKQITKNVSINIRDNDDREIAWLRDSKQIAFRRTIYEDEGI